jgi:50S ribosomal protein L16 3-hydroxylase
MPTSTASPLAQLGGLSATQFLSEYWNKKPLLIRQAFANFEQKYQPFNIADVLKLAGYDEAQARLVVNTPKSGQAPWLLERGPFRKKRFDALKGQKWTVLVQDTQHFSHEAHALLAHFDFISYDRIDDLMVSYAPKGGGVGPHVDSYDVFLLQGTGSRRWQISAKPDLTWVKDAPLKILKNFKAEQEWVLEAGDMLYLPPGYAHNGEAQSDCLTWSIGFRAPAREEIAGAYLDYQRDNLKLLGLVQESERAATLTPGHLSQSSLQDYQAALLALPNSSAQMTNFIGGYLTAAKNHVMFIPPEISVTPAKFARDAAKCGLRLDLRSRMMRIDSQFFINGFEAGMDANKMPTVDVMIAEVTALFESLANTRVASPACVSAALANAEAANGIKTTLYEWFDNGFIEYLN